MYMNDDGRLFIIVIKFYLMFYNGWFVYVISEKKFSENYFYRILFSNCVFWYWCIVYLMVFLIDLWKNYIIMYIIRLFVGMLYKKKGIIIWML